MDDEIKNFIKVWITAITCLCYCYYAAANIPKGMFRLLSLIPIFYIFSLLPLNLSIVHLCGPTAFFLTWLGNFKLFLFSFDLGPLSPHPPKSLLHFMSIASLPIKIKSDPSPKSPPKTKFESDPSSNTKNESNPSPDIAKKWDRSLVFAIKFVLLCVILCSFDFRQYLHPNAVLALYCCYVYLALEVVLALLAAPVRAIIGLELEPHFNEPYLATSLQDFWGRRWNLMVTSILRPTVYDPVRRISIRILGYSWARGLAILATFLVSGLMHELIYFYLIRASPTWEVTWFFVLQGVCTAVEIGVKRIFAGRWRLHRAVSGPLTVAFVAVTGAWLFFPQFLRSGVDEKTIREYSIMKDFVRYLLDSIFGVFL